VFRPAGASRGFSDDDCDISADGGLCLYGGKKVVLRDAVPAGLVGSWSFDEVQAVDRSGEGNHARFSVAPGPGVNGHGASAMFNGFDWLEIPNSPALGDSSVFSVSFWLFLSKDPNTAVRHGAKWCPLVHKGSTGDERAPQLLIHSESRQLNFVTSTSSAAHPEGEALLSAARVPVQRWVHVALVRETRATLLYVNGMLDANGDTEGDTATNVGPLYVGSTPWQVDACHIPAYIDNLKFYSRPLVAAEVEAEAFGALGGIEASFARLGCQACTLEKAGESCPASYHLCTAMELHTGGYQVARLMGYADWSGEVWSHGAFAKKVGGESGDMQSEMAFAAVHEEKLGLGLCCNDVR
jgi:hypothetical protein